MNREYRSELFLASDAGQAAHAAAVQAEQYSPGSRIHFMEAVIDNLRQSIESGIESGEYETEDEDQ